MDAKMDIDFLRKIQSLHDENDYWDDKGLSSRGIYMVNFIIKEYHLNMAQM